MLKKLSMAPLMLLSFLVTLCVLTSYTSSSSFVSFPLTHRDAESSLVRSQEADPSELPLNMPMRDFVAAGRAMRGRITNQGRATPGANIVERFSYLKEKVGDFYLTLSVGTPHQSLIFTLDTGSELVWTQCEPCEFCRPKSSSPTFTFNKSSSFLAVPCTSRLCGEGLGLATYCSNSTNSCIFFTRYGDGSLDGGYISVDSFHFSQDFSKRLVFGCAVIELETVGLPTPVILPSSGIMGLNAGPFSFPSQLFSNNPNLSEKFAYCLPDRFTNLNSEGTIQFGNYKLQAEVKYTPLVPPDSLLGDVYYFVKLEGISVGKRFIKAEMKDEAVGTAWTIFDSGTSVTFLELGLYEEMIMQMRKQTAALNPFMTKGVAADLCYRVASTSKELPKVPMITMHFAGKVDLELGPESILYPADSDNKGITLCMAFVGINATLNIIGNYQQQNHWVEYNLQTSSLGLAKASCVPRK